MPVLLVESARYGVSFVGFAEANVTIEVSKSSVISLFIFVFYCVNRFNSGANSTIYAVPKTILTSNV